MVFNLICNKCVRKPIRNFLAAQRASVSFKLGKEKQIKEEPGAVGLKTGHNASVNYSRREIYFIPSKNE